MSYKTPQKLVKIANLPVGIIKDMVTLIDAMSSGYDLDPTKYQNLADSIQDRFHRTSMTWNWFSPYAHILLVHGKEIIESCPIAPGLMSEVTSTLHSTLYFYV